MFRCDHVTGIAILPPPTPIRLRPEGGFFARGNPRQKTDGTIIDAEWLNMIQEELCQVVLKGITGDGSDGEALDKADYTQLVRTIVGMSPGGPGTGTGGAEISEPPDDGRLYSRTNPTTAGDAPPETGSWFPAVPEPRADGIAYSRRNELVAGVEVPEWVVATGRRRVTSTASGTFYVEKTGFNGDHATTPGDGSQESPWRTIQYAINFIVENIDAGGFGVIIQVGTHDVPGTSTTPWEGFEVVQRVTGCPPNGFQIIGDTNNPDTRELGRGTPLIAGPSSRCCIYANGGRVNVSGFFFQQPSGATPATRGVAILCEGSGSVVTIDNKVVFIGVANSQDHMWANNGGVIHVKANYELRNGATTVQADKQRHHIHVSNAGQIIYVDPFVITFTGLIDVLVFIMGETAGIALMRYTFGWTGTTQPGGAFGTSNQMRKWYICGKAVIDCTPQFPLFFPPASTWTLATQIIPGRDPETQTPGSTDGRFSFTGGQHLPLTGAYNTFVEDIDAEEEELEDV
jgi:hypothetical protein